MRKYFSILLLTCGIILISGCANGEDLQESTGRDVERPITSTDSAVEESMESSMEEEEVSLTEDAEKPLTEEEALRLDSENDSIQMIIDEYKLEYSGDDTAKVVTFTDFINDFKEIKDDNLFADAVVKASENVKYDELSIDEQVAFDSYLSLLFNDDVVRNERSIGSIIEAWHGNGHATNKSSGEKYLTHYYLLKFSDYNIKII